MFCSVMSKTQMVRIIIQELRFNDIFTIISMLLTFESFLILLRQSTIELHKILAILVLLLKKCRGGTSSEIIERFGGEF